MSFLKRYGWKIVWIALPFLPSCSYTFYTAACTYPLPASVHKVTNLDDRLNESSGIVKSDSVFYTFNDSGAGPDIFSFTQEIPLLQKTVISNATNADWEDIAYDGEYFYIADVGNNFGTRDTLVIYKISSEEILKGKPVAAAKEKITFSYNEEVFMNDAGWYSHDCEALIAYGDSLYLFSKDWVGKSTRIYTLPKQEGHYAIRHRNEYQVDALITGSDVDPLTKEVVLVGYRNYIPILIVYNFETDPSVIKCGGRARKYPLKIGTQVEAVCFGEKGRIYITAEKQLYKQALYTTYY